MKFQTVGGLNPLQTTYYMEQAKGDLPKRPLYVVISRRISRGKEVVQCHYHTRHADVSVVDAHMKTMRELIPDATYCVVSI